MKSSKRGQSGFTLLEIMVVIVILGMLVAIVAPNVLQNQDKAMVEKAKADIAILEQALEMYKLDTHRYPTTDQSLESLVTVPDGLDGKASYRTEGYIKRLPKDPWGNAYQYVSPGEHNAFDIYSYGADGVDGGDGLSADIGNW